MNLIIKQTQNVKPNFFVNTPRIIYVRDFDEDAGESFSSDFNHCVQAAQPIIPVIVESYGGDLYTLNSILSTLESVSNETKILTYIGGKAMSCGAVLASTNRAKGLRFMSPHAQMLIHEISSFSEGKQSDMRASVMASELLNDELFNMLDSNAGKPAGYFKKIIEKNRNVDLYFSAQDCLKHGLIDYIGIPQLIIEPKISYDVVMDGHTINVESKVLKNKAKQ